MLKQILWGAMLALGVSLVPVGDAIAKDNNGKGHAKNSHPSKLKSNNRVAIPPGQIKRYTRGAKLPGDLVWRDIGDLSKWKLKPPGKGHRYIRVGDDILEVTEDLSTVVEAIGIVDDLLK